MNEWGYATEDHRFVAVFEDDTCAVWRLAQAGNNLDMSDTLPPFKLYFSDGGHLFPVTRGPLQRHDGAEGVIYGHYDLIANGKIIGICYATDH